MKPLLSLALATALVGSASAWAHAGDGAASTSAEAPAPPAPSATLVGSLRDPGLRELVMEVLDRNPQLAVLSARARAADQRAPQVSALPDPMASLTFFLLEPQTRVGPQQAAASLSQRLPWFGKLKLKEQVATLEAAAEWTRVETARLGLVTTVRRLALELHYLDRERGFVVEDQTTLEHYERLAQARYASGVGIDQSVIKIQAEITRARNRLLGLDERRAALVAELNALRDRPDGTVVALGAPAVELGSIPPLDRLREAALAAHPELAEAQARIDAAGVRIDVAESDFRPDFTVGLNYALVGRREDSAGRLMPPEGNGDDILGLTGGVNLPMWRGRLKAGVEEAIEQRLAAEESRRSTTARIEGELSDLARRIPLIREQVELYAEILIVQAEESLHSAEVAYASGTASALDLLDAERVLLGVRIGAARSRADLAIAAAKLEGVVATPLESINAHGGAS